MTQKANFEKIFIFFNSAFNIRKIYKMSSRKALYFRSYQPKTSPGLEPPVLLGLNMLEIYVVIVSASHISHGWQYQRKFQPTLFFGKKYIQIHQSVICITLKRSFHFFDSLRLCDKDMNMVLKTQSMSGFYSGCHGN